MAETVATGDEVVLPAAVPSIFEQHLAPVRLEHRGGVDQPSRHTLHAGPMLVLEKPVRVPSPRRLAMRHRQLTGHFVNADHGAPQGAR
jgi:hypothetical protein